MISSQNIDQWMYGEVSGLGVAVYVKC